MTEESKAQYLIADTTVPLFYLDCERKLNKITEILKGNWYIEDLPRVVVEIQNVLSSHL